MKLYLVHCGFYDSEICDGVCESHANFFTVGEDQETAKRNARLNPIFKQKNMHIDVLKEIEEVDGYSVQLQRGL